MKCILVSLAAFIAGAVLTYIITNNGDTAIPLICPKIDYTNEPAFPAITEATATALALSYANECQPALTRLRPQGADNNPDARSINFTLPTLKKYIWELEKIVCATPSNNVNDLGIRFYYGKYPNLSGQNIPEDLASLPQTYSYRHTIFLVPTKKVGEVYQDFNPNNTQPANDKTGDNIPNAFLMNHGNVYPPPFGQPGEAPQAANSRNGMKY